MGCMEEEEWHERCRQTIRGYFDQGGLFAVCLCQVWYATDDAVIDIETIWRSNTCCTIDQGVGVSL